VALLDRRPHRAGARFTGELAPAFFSKSLAQNNYRTGIAEIQTERDSVAAAAPFIVAHGTQKQVEGGIMLYWTLLFLVIALIAGVLGFTSVAIAAAGIAKLLFFVFLVLFVISLVTHLTRRSRV
jgi:uncharacterized membrane protein YtjA (UPF0391 family)